MQRSELLPAPLVVVADGETLDPGEDPLDCAFRELAEETGLKAGRMEHLATFYTSPGIVTEAMHSYLARDLEEGSAALEEDEVLVPVKIPFEEALSMAASGRLKDAKTIATLFLADAYLRREKESAP